MNNLGLFRRHHRFGKFTKPHKSTRTMKINKTIAVSLLASALMITLSACDNQGPAEEAGEEIDNSIDDAGDAIEDATDGR